MGLHGTHHGIEGYRFKNDIDLSFSIGNDKEKVLRQQGENTWEYHDEIYTSGSTNMHRRWWLPEGLTQGFEWNTNQYVEHVAKLPVSERFERNCDKYVLGFYLLWNGPARKSLIAHIYMSGGPWVDIWSVTFLTIVRNLCTSWSCRVSNSSRRDERGIPSQIIPLSQRFIGMTSGLSA